MPYRYRLIAAYTAVMLLAILLSGFIYLNDQRLQATSEQLFNKTLPLLRTINQLRSAKVEHERLLYEYYATTDRLRLLPAIQASQSLMADRFEALDGQQLEMFDETRTTFEGIKAVALKLDQNLMNDQVDWDLARAHLIELSNAGRMIDPYLDTFVRDVEAQARRDSDASRAGGKLGTQLVIGFCLAIVGIALFVAFFVDRYIRETAERKRLAMFPERNPNPVISTDSQGNINYLNPAAEDFLREQQLEGKEKQLIPQNLKQAWHSHDEAASGTITLSERLLEYNLSTLKDLELAHIHYKDITEQHQAEQALSHQAKHDLLTQLPNRGQLEIALAENTHNTNSFHLVLLNLHHFERITATYGYQYGDMLLRHASQRINEHLQTENLLQPGLCRMDGSNFAFMVPGSGLSNTQQQQMQQLADTILAAFEEPVCINDNEFYLPLCMGISQFPSDSNNVSGLLKCADSALMQSRKVEGNCIQFYSSQLQDTYKKNLTIENELRQAIANSELELFYQPKMDNHTGAVTSCESLLRWLTPEGVPRYSPVEFIPIAEQSGLIIPLGEWVLETAFAQANVWRDSQPMVTAINLSQRQFQHHDFLPLLKRLKARYPGIEPYIELEITESLLMQDISSSIDTMHAIKDLGFGLSIDDFGTGYSSLSYLKEFPIDKLKIDRSFIIDMTNNKEDKMLVETIIQLAHSLGLATVAEGVETQDQLAALQTIHCTETQGYLISKPLPAREYGRFMEEFQRNQSSVGLIR
jgi:diguanylate cyclase (GGDEF)-like protein